MEMKKFRFIDHTGDLGIEVFGDSLASLFQHAGEAFTAIVTDGGMIGLRESRRISLEADGVEDLLVRWLNEFIFLFDTQGLLLRAFDIISIDDRHVKADVQGEVYDETRHQIKTTVKGATYHQLEVIRKDGTWKARVIFDL
jgi:SHS2 domain-containing protein